MKRPVQELLILFAGIMILSLTGCGHESKKDIPIIYLDKEIVSIEKKLRVDTIPGIESLIYARDLYVYQDSVLIVRNAKGAAYYIDVYKYPSMEPIKSLFRHGQGPDELLSAQSLLNMNKLIVNDYLQKKVAVIDIDSLLAYPDYHVRPAGPLGPDASKAVPYKGKYIFRNIYSFSDDNAGIHQEAPAFIVTDGSKEYVEKKKYKYYTANVVMNGMIIVNEKKDRIFFASSDHGIEIFDMELNLLKKIEGPVDLNHQYHIDESMRPMFVCFRAISYAYEDSCVDDEYLYLNYVGDKLSKEKRRIEDMQSHIFKFDWDGNFINSYPVGKYAVSLSKSPTENALYIAIPSGGDDKTMIKLYMD